MATAAWRLRVGRRGVLLLIGCLVLLAANSGLQAAAGDPMEKVEAKLLEEMASKGEATFFVVLKQKADLRPAHGIGNRTQRGVFVHQRLQAVAEASQAPLRRWLADRGVSHQPFWIVNAIRVTGDEALLGELAARPEVDRIVLEGAYEIPKPEPGSEEALINAVEWNIDRIRAPLAWSTFGTRGEGIVVANVDTGVQFDHPALVQQYRGNLGGGSFDHNYNWRDPSNICGSPSNVPCDNNGHGTHTMGTMVGDDGDPGANQIGVAPHARFMACKGCEFNSCSDSALLGCGQWILAPTDLNNQNPRPDLRPHVVNNSWGGGPGDPFYQATVDAWVASGIFPAFSNGNAGPGCFSAGSPGDFLNTYAAGAFDINNNIAGFSSRGPSAFGGELKPNIAAPGVNVRSSVPFNSYASFNGTSMASPHVAGTVALMWSAAIALVGDIDSTRDLLDGTAIDTFDAQCGGDADDNNVFGEGRLDAFDAVDQSPRGPTGTLDGTVTEDPGGAPIAGATLHAVGPADRTTTAGAGGNYSFTLPIGTYDVTASAFGFVSETATGVEVTDGGVTTQDFALQQAPSHPVSGHVRDGDGNPIANAKVTILGTPIPPALTDGAGFYSFASVPEGTYVARAEAGRCNDPQEQALVVAGPTTLDFVLPQRSDSFGYFCQVVPVSFVDANTVLPLSGDDASAQVSLPFPFTFYGETHSTAHVATNGFLNFLAPNATFGNSGIPSSFAPNGAVYPFWDDLFVDGSASVRTQLLGAAPNRQFVIEWRNVHFFGDPSRRLRFEVVLFENGRILTQYTDINNADGREKGDSATVGIENQTGTVALQYSSDQASLENDFAVLYRLPPSGFIQGTVRDGNDNLPLGGATVRFLRDGSLFRQTTTDAAGFYRAQLPLDTYTVEASATNYSTESAQVVLDQEDEVAVQNFTLDTARGVVTPTSLQLVVPANQTRTRTLRLSNTGGVDMTWEIRETGGGQAAASLQAQPRKGDFDPNSTTTDGLYENPLPGWEPSAPGDVIRSWAPTGLSLAWGVGYTGSVWLSDIPTNNRNHEFTGEGAATGRNWPAPWAGAWPGDMALDTAHNLMCQVNVGGDNGIYCWNISSGAVEGSITGAFPWTGISQRGLAYRSDDDSFYIGGWNEGILYHVKGLSHPDKGAVIGQCSPPDPNISGLAWNPAFGIVWSATNSPTDTIYQLDPDTCQVLSTLPHPSPGFAGAGLEMDEAGNLWMIDQAPNTVYLIDSGVPAFVDVPWLSESPTSGIVAPGATQDIQVTVDTTGLQPGVYNATLFIATNSGRQPQLQVPVRLIVPAYQQGVDVAANSGYVDVNADAWARDQAWTAGSWGYVTRGNEASTNSAIAGTEDDQLYKTARRGATEYRFDGLPPGKYQVELRFAEIQNRKPGQRIFDVTIEGNIALFAFDIAAEVGKNAADDKSFILPVTDGQLNVRFVMRQADREPLINAIRVTHRPDQ